MKTIRMIGAMLVLVTACVVTPALAAKQEPPAPEPMKKLAFPDYSEITLKNGLQVVVVEQHEQPVASIWLAFQSGSVLDPEGKSSLASFTGTLLNKGTATRDSKQLAEWIESVGGSVNVSTDEDNTIITISLLSEHLQTAYEYLADIVLTPTFPEDELAEERKRTITGLEFEKSDPDAMADRYFYEVVYGHHPYAIRPTTETVEAVTRDDIVAFHKRNYVPNNALLFVVGDVKKNEVKKAAEKYLGDWKAGTPDKADYAAPPERTATNISLYHRPGSVQTNVYIGQLGLKPKSPDWPAITVGNRVLGGGSSGRLFMDIREDKGWTYGAYSRWTKPVDIGYFRATANVRTEVSDSALTAMLDEVKRMVDEPVSDKELESAKSYLVGNFPTTIETPTQIAAQIGQVKLLGLDKSYLENYRKDIAKVTVADVQAAMQRDLHPDRLAIVLVGDAVAIKDKVEEIAPVALYDIDGNPMSLDDLSVQGTDFDYDTSLLKNATATYAVMMKEMTLGEMNVSLEKKGEDFSASSSISGMFTMKEAMTFGEDFDPMSYTFSMVAGPQNVSADLAFADGKATGHIEDQDGPKDVDVAMVKGMILKNAIDLVVSTLPLEAGANWKFPVLDAQSGDVENVTVEVEGVEDVTVPAGAYATYKVKVKSGDGEQILYAQKTTPHWVVRSEVPAQGLSISLKSLTM